MSCEKECQPVEQIRGEMKMGDYFDVIVNNRIPVPGAVFFPEKYGYPVFEGQQAPANIDPQHCVEMTEHNKTDFRICCKTCGKATPWGAQDIPGMPGAGADWTRKKWNDS